MIREGPQTTTKTGEPFGSNAVRLSGRQWVVAAVVLLAFFFGIPTLWRHLEAFEPGTDYRIPYNLGNDYWHYDRYCNYAARQHKVLVIGDSVIWGEYVTPGEMLTHQLNAIAGEDRFINLGVNGIHPVALAGLIAYYGRAVRGQRVLLHYNPLWMSSERHDLQTKKEFRFNHPKLVPQFLTKIPCYKDPWAGRIGIVVERYFPFRAWIDHLAIAYFDNTDLAAWARENPYSGLLRRITLKLPRPDMAQRHPNKPWYETGKPQVNFKWVDADTSLQWRLFQETVRTLDARGNSPFILVGPFNEHMMKPEGLEAYAAVKRTIEAWLQDQRLLHYVAPVLPSELYGDASHPLAEGYTRLANQLLEQDAFRDFALSQDNLKVEL